ncbi:hypothetical protein ACO3VM_05750 [Methanocaldococcus sp. 10A]
MGYHTTGKPILIIIAKLSKHYVNKLYFENTTVFVNQEIIVSYGN